MPELETPTQCVLTLSEAAEFLRVSDEALADKAMSGAVPARQIGGEWRFLRQALVDWLYAGATESANGASGRPLPGSKEAVFRHFGVLRDHDDLEATLAGLAEQGGVARRRRFMIVFDSDIFTLFAYGHEKVKKRYDETDDVFAVTVITWIEVLKGRTDSLLKAADEKELRVAAERMRHTETVLNDFAVLPVDDSASGHFGKLSRHKKLAKIRRADLLIACVVLARQARLVTRNLKDFKDVPGLRVENWAD